MIHPNVGEIFLMMLLIYSNVTEIKHFRFFVN